MSKAIWACCALALLSTPVVAQPAPPPSESVRFQAQDLFGLEVASDPQISPDGSRVAYVRQTADIMTDRMRPTIWLIDVRTGQQTPLVAGAGSHSQPRWSPDGTRVAYISTAEGGGAQMFVRWIGSGQSVRVTSLPNTPTGISWSPDGTKLAYSVLVAGQAPKLGAPLPKPEGAQWAPPLEVIDTVTYRADGQGYLKPGYRQVFVAPADGGGARQLTQGDFNHGGDLSWSPDSATLYLSANRGPDWQREAANSEVYALDVRSGVLTALTDRLGPDQSPVASPDGRRIAYVGYDDQRLGYQNTRLYVMDRDGANRRVLTAGLDRSVQSPVWSKDGRSILIAYDDHGSTTIARVSLDGAVSTIVQGLSGSDIGRPYSGGDFSLADDGSVAFTRGDALRPADVHVLRQGRQTQLTRLNADYLASKILGAVQRLEVASSHDGRTVESWLTLPAGYVEGQKYPLILEIHGGPFAAYGPHFATDNQLFGAAGYAVLSVNPRGSTSYGEEFANLIHHDYPGHDYDDLMSSVDAVIAKGVADPDRLFVTGGSGGGVLTAWIVGKTNRFKAAASQKPVIDWASFVLTADNPAFFARYWFGEYPWENHEAYWRRSPLSLVGNVTTPTLVVVGDEDYRTPVSESEQYYTALQLRGVPTALVKIPGVGHGLAVRPSQNAARISAILTWFDRYKNGAPAPASPPPTPVR
ncbi:MULTISPECIES: prolyl oligopeptidase family serine peptidase [unclassified Brevundimonas]|uniref:prolyl oligopeptidase family serine peptidase n=1 Tax=unclassified Brevundimonas TaxID=2622653 RepID=UPI003F90A978